MRASITLLIMAVSFGVCLLLPDSASASAPKVTFSETDPFSVSFFNSFIIILREGFEAILVISALAAYLSRSGHPDKVRTIYMGAGYAIVASILTALLLGTLIDTSGSMEAFEGITMLFATAVLFYVSYWLISKVEVGRWQDFIKSQIQSSISKGSVFALATAAFLAVYREGAETILFYMALLSSSGGNSVPIVSGFLVGTISLVAVFYGFRAGIVRVPIGPFFAVTSTFLYYLAFTFAGRGVHELQEAGWIQETHIEGFIKIRSLGIYPTVETLSIQAVLLVALIGAVFYSFVYRPYKDRTTATQDLTHIEGDLRSLHDLLEDVTSHIAKCRSMACGEDDSSAKEMEEMARHMSELDEMSHEVIDHLAKLEGSLRDIFTDLEDDLKSTSRKAETETN